METVGSEMKEARGQVSGEWGRVTGKVMNYARVASISWKTLHPCVYFS